ncbi:choice-of-anchor I family protein [Confluentibacter flavum]|uniref:Alkaline phosphatase n=1 Tax=Confluentibacter flavum TaxID=1909700 RepID=A0A2N3HPT6_9FLAO|nr:choice-of-anchor I family protein [Confluentibacter flavum]PKQ46932.1 alkaline phosphatase [Confluentibacter flavum]
MKTNFRLSILALLITFSSCNKVDDIVETDASLQAKSAKSSNFNVNFKYKTTIKVGGETASEITAFDPQSKKLFVVNLELNQISVFDISDIDNPKEEAPLVLGSGTPNSVAVSKGLVAVAVEAAIKQDLGSIMLFEASSGTLLNSYQVGALPDMVTFSPNGKYIVSANEGEPNSLYTVDPKGSISIIEIIAGTTTTLYFDDFNSQQSMLEAGGFRVFGPNATLAMDVEPEYVAISDNSRYAWVTLQENNGVAKINLETKQIETIYPLGFKDYNLIGNEIDASDDDGIKALNNWPVYGIYMPDAIKYIKVNGMDYLITANEGDAREYIDNKGTDDEDDDEEVFVEEARVKNLDLDPIAFPNAAFLQEDENLGRLKITKTLGDTDGDGDYDELYSFGARSFTVWTGNGQMVYDSGNDIALQTLNLTPDRFNDGDGRSDDKGAEPESVEVLTIQGNKHVLFVGLERNDQIMVYDISNPASPIFLDILSHDGDEGPEGLISIPSKDSPNGKDLLIVSNEDSGTVTIYENNQKD